MPVVNPGIRRLLASAIQRLFNGASFSAPLTHSAIPTRAASGTTATFTRATTATVKDNEGILHTVPSGCARFEGARYVRNLIGNSEDFAAAYWLKSGATISASNTIANPIDGALTADTLTASAGNAPHFLYKSGLTVSAGRHIQSWYVQYIGHRWVVIQNYDGTTAWEGSFDLLNGVVGAVTAGALSTIESLGYNWYRIALSSVYVASTGAYSVLALNNSDSASIQTWNAAGTESVGVWGHQLEDITGRADQTTPSEYVSVGALDYRSELNRLYLSLPGTASHDASTTDSVATSITGDMTVVFCGAASDWTPAAAQYMMSKHGAAGQLGVQFYLDTTVPTLAWSADGTTIKTAAATTGVSFVDGGKGYIAATLDIDNGAGGYTVKFYTSTDGSTWTQLGNAVTAAGVTSQFDNTAGYVVGGYAGGTGLRFIGRVYSAQVYSGIRDLNAGTGGTLVVDFNPHRDAVTPTGTITSSTTGEVWTINGASSVVRSDYYHGSMVDGVKCFPTDLSGNPIPSTTMLGYSAEGARTNLCLQSNAFTTTWAPVGTPTITQNAIGPDGAISAWTITDDNAAANECPVQDVTLTAATWTTSVFVGKTTGAQSSYPIIYSYSPVSALVAICTVDTSNGIATAWTAYTGLTIASGLVARCRDFNDDFWRVEISYTATATAWQQALIPAGTANATQSTGTPAAATVGSAVFYGAQVELGSFASSYIPTTTIAVARNADVLAYSSAGNILGTAGWVHLEYLPPSTTITQAALLDPCGATGRSPLYRSNSRTLSMYDGTTVLNGTTMIPVVQYKLAASWGSNQACSVNGAAVISDAFDGDYTIAANIAIGSYSDGSSGAFGTIRNVRIGQRQLSASELQAITA